MRLFKRGKYYQIEFKRGVQRSLGTEDKREAQRLFKIAREEFLKGRLVKLDDRDRITLQEFYGSFIRGKAGLSSRTLRMYEMSIRFLAAGQFR